MAGEVINLLGPGAITIGVILLALVLVIVFLSFTQRGLKKKLAVRQTQMKRFQKFYNGLENFRNSTESPDKVFLEFDKHAKNTIREKYQLSQRTDYSEMMHLFDGLGKKHLSQFCAQMLQILYSGDKMTKQKLDVLIKNFETIVREERIRPIQKLNTRTNLHSDIIKPKPLVSTPQIHKKPLEIPSVNVSKPHIIPQAPTKQITAKPVMLDPKMPQAKHLPAKPILEAKPKHKRTFWQVIFGIYPDKIKAEKTKPPIAPKPIVSPKKPLAQVRQMPSKPLVQKKKRTFLQIIFGIYPDKIAKEIRAKKEMNNLQKLKTNPTPINEDPKPIPKSVIAPKATLQKPIPKTPPHASKPKRTFFQVIFGIYPEKLKASINMPQDKIKQDKKLHEWKPEQNQKPIVQSRTPVMKTAPSTEKKPGFFARLFGAKTQPAPEHKLPDLVVPELPDLSAKPSTPIKEVSKPVVAAPAPQPKLSVFGGLFKKPKKVLDISTRQHVDSKALPKNFGLYQVKEGVTGIPQQQQTPKNVSTKTPESKNLVDNKQIEGIDNLDRIKSRINMIHKLRKEAKLEK